MKKNCWNQVGVWGDLTCPQLTTEIHCHNCAVYSQGGRSLLDRLEPEGYTAEWTALTAQPLAQSFGAKQQAMRQTRLSLTIFRLGQEWLALPASILDQVIAPSPVHALPHRQDPLLRGIVNVRGQLLPCVSLHELLGITTAESAVSTTLLSMASRAKQSRDSHADHNATKALLTSGQQGGYPRLIVVKKAREIWAFEVDELYGLHLCQKEALRLAPSLSNQALNSLTQSIFSWNDQNVSYLEVEQLFSVLKQRAL